MHPGKALPDVRGRLVNVRGSNLYEFEIGPAGETITIIEGPHEDKHLVGEVLWLQYNGYSRADHHRFWSIKFQTMQDDTYLPLDLL